MPGITLAAPAKLNLTLEVIGKRPDGYHSLRSVMQAITLCDRLTASPGSGLTLECSVPALSGSANLAWRAGDLLRRETGTARGASLWLEKAIPVAAGLGGGSSDAATALLALNTLWGTGLSRDDLRRLGARIGSDVPFFLGESATALVEGRGERVTPLPALPARWLVLARAPIAVSTATVFGALTREGWSDGRRTADWVAPAGAGGATPAPFNDLEPVTLRVEPGARLGREALERAGARGVTLSGSGPTYFALVADERAGAALLDAIREQPGPALYTAVARFGDLAGR